MEINAEKCCVRGCLPKISENQWKKPIIKINKQIEMRN